MKNYALFGNPLIHSESPFIHRLFSQQLQINYRYKLMLVCSDSFITNIKNFFKHGGMGANISSPFKEKAFFLADELTERAALSGVINTLKRLDNGKLLGDNTDGVGLFKDLTRLSFIKNNRKILLIGAGGASRGVVLPLLALNCIVTITNRSFFRARKIANLFSYAGDIKAVEMNSLTEHKFDLIINATSSGFNREVPSIPSNIINENVFCYDMFYQRGGTPFLFWCTKNGAKQTADGIGMLAWQAAYSVLLWHGVFPVVDPVIEKLKERMY